MSDPSARRSEADPTLVRNQPALRTSHGTIWVVVGALFTAVSLIPIVLIAREAGPAAPVAIGTGTVVVLLFLALLVVRFAVPPGVRRLRVMAVLLLSIAVIALGGMILCVALERLSLDALVL